MSFIVKSFHIINRYYTINYIFPVTMVPLIVTKFYKKNFNKKKNDKVMSDNDIFDKENRLLEYMPPIKQWHPESNTLYPWEIDI